MSIQIMLPKTLTDDNIINVEESKKVFTIKGKAQGAKKGDRVRLTVNGQTMSTSVRDDLSFTLYVRGSDLFASKEPQFVVSVSSKNAQGKMETVNAIHRYQIDNKPNTITPPPPPETPPPTIQLDAVTSDNFVNQVEQNGQIKISGRVGGSTKVGDKVEITIHNQTQTVTVQSDNTFQLMVSGSLLRDDTDHAIEAKLSTLNTSGKNITVSHLHNYSSVKQVSGVSVGDVGQSQVAYFIRSIVTDSTSGYLNSTTTRYRDRDGNIKYGLWDGVGKGIEVTYSFATEAHGGERGFRQYSAGQKAAVRDALSEYETYANIRFREVTDDGTAAFRFYLDDLTARYNKVSTGTPTTPTSQNMCSCCGGLHRTGVKVDDSLKMEKTFANKANSSSDPQYLSVTTGYAYYGGDVHMNGDMFSGDSAMSKDTDSVTYQGYPFDSGYGTLVHEIGHSLGLKHPGNYNGLNGSAAGPYLPIGEENTAHSIMSYNDSNQMTGKGLQIFDLAAIHYRYGVNRNQRAGNDTYSFKAYNRDVVGNDVYIWDGAGVDTFDASAEAQGVTVDLTPGSWNYSGRKSTNFLTEADGRKTVGQSFIGYGTQIENLIGSEHGDTLTGNKADNNIYGGAGNDRINGNEGNDTLDGGAGNDTLIGGAGNDNYIVDSTKDIIQESLNQGNDTVLSSVDYTLGEHVENLTLLGNAIQGTGNALNNIITGNQANNILRGGTGSDTYVLNAGFGQDLIYNQNDGQDVLRLAHISHAQMFNLKQIKRQNNDLLLNVADSNDSVTVKDWFADAQNQIATIAFQDKSVTANEINALLANGANQLIQAIHTFGSNSGASTLTMSPQPNMKSTELLVSSS